MRQGSPFSFLPLQIRLAITNDYLSLPLLITTAANQVTQTGHGAWLRSEIIGPMKSTPAAASLDMILLLLGAFILAGWVTPKGFETLRNRVFPIVIAGSLLLGVINLDID
jgi:hypothetical protein